MMTMTTTSTSTVSTSNTVARTTPVASVSLSFPYSKMIFRVTSIARAHATLATRRYASSSVTTTTSKPLSPLNSFARAWYNMYVQINDQQSSSARFCDGRLTSILAYLIASFFSDYLYLSISLPLLTQLSGLAPAQRDMLPFWR
jgi:hypothetical protein